MMAQLVECQTSVHEVVGLIPTWRSKFSYGVCPLPPSLSQKKYLHVFLFFSSDIDLDFPKIYKTSKINLKAQDQNGKTVLHHLVCSLDFGSYDNVEILKLLVTGGASLQEADDDGKLPLDYAISNGATKLVKAMQKLMGKKKNEWVGSLCYLTF